MEPTAFNSGNQNYLWEAHNCDHPHRSTPETWTPGDPTHWIEQTQSSQIRSIILRIILFLQLSASTFYLQYRIRFTVIPLSSTSTSTFILQITFVIYEILVTIFPLTTIFETWHIGLKRNGIDFNNIPYQLLEDCFQHDEGQDIKFRNYPTISIIIPCYKEPINIVRKVIKSTLQVDYPKELLFIYLCDDSRDHLKQLHIQSIQQQYENVNIYYVTRPDNKYAKPGNVNFILNRIKSDLVVQLDADFIIRKNLIQRLLPYFYLWNTEKNIYEFNNTISYIQTPQYYRNLNVKDSDYFDQRNLFFFQQSQPSKDYYNGSTMLGTSNLINKSAIESVEYFPYHSVGDDTALSLILHAKGFVSYYVQECVATGLVPHTLRGNFRERSRWYKSDWQILFSKRGPLTENNLSLKHRILYLNVIINRLRSIIAGFGLEIILTVVLIFNIGVFTVQLGSELRFLAVLSAHLGMPILWRLVLCVGKDRSGIMKSLAGQEMFEVVFKWNVVKGCLQTLFGVNMGWKVAEKKSTTVSGIPTFENEQKKSNNNRSDMIDEISYEHDEKYRNYEDDSDSDEGVVKTDPNERLPVIKTENQANDSNGNKLSTSIMSVVIPMFSPRKQHPLQISAITASTGSDDDIKHESSSEECIRNPSTTCRTSTSSFESATLSKSVSSRQYWKKTLRNLKRCCYNILMGTTLTTILIYSVVLNTNINTNNNRDNNEMIPLVLAFGYMLSNLVPHALAIILCFKRKFIKDVEGNDDGLKRCDEWTDNNSSSLYVPISPVCWLAWARTFIVVACFTYTVIRSNQPHLVNRLAKCSFHTEIGSGISAMNGKCMV